MIAGKVSDSRFHMWRAVVAVAHADSVVQPHEIHFIIENTKKLPLDDTQRETLALDMDTPGDIETLFAKITNRKDREDFFHLARALSWSDGNLDERERNLLRIVGAPARAGEVESVKVSQRHFRDIYIEGDGAGVDKTLFDVVKGLIDRP